MFDRLVDSEIWFLYALKTDCTLVVKLLKRSVSKYYQFYNSSFFFFLWWAAPHDDLTLFRLISFATLSARLMQFAMTANVLGLPAISVPVSYIHLFPLRQLSESKSHWRIWNRRTRTCMLIIYNQCSYSKHFNCWFLLHAGLLSRTCSPSFQLILTQQ